jgi:1-acyl-sn-glycerol-3-phosphate acyltransferase
VSIFRTIICFFYLFGYMLLHLPVLRKGEKALAAGDRAAVDAITAYHVPHWCSTILKLSGVRVTVTGRENVPDGACVYVANHRGYFDIPVLLSCLEKPYGLLAKVEIDRIPLIRRWMRLIGCVFVDRGDVHASMQALAAATETVAAGRCFTIFPEGTRYKGEEGGLGECKGGAFRVATKCGAPLVPVAITGTRGAFEDNYNRMHPAQVAVHILPAVPTAGLSRAEQKALPAAVEATLRQELSVMVHSPA